MKKLQVSKRQTQKLNRGTLISILQTIKLKKKNKTFFNIIQNIMFTVIHPQESQLSTG